MYKHQREIYYREVCIWWRTTSEENIEMEEPDEVFGLQVAILRRKLRVIWSIANLGDMKLAISRTHQIHIWLDRMPQGGSDPSDGKWRDRRFAATEELMSILPRLMICEYQECKNRYFIRDTQRKYCSKECTALAQESRRLERIAAGQPSGNMTEEGKAKISMIQKKRWEKFRSERHKERMGQRRSTRGLSRKETAGE